MTGQNVSAEEVLLGALRWKADMQITNYDGEEVWLKQIPGGITDCCFAEFPCERHAAMTT